GRQDPRHDVRHRTHLGARAGPPVARGTLEGGAADPPAPAVRRHPGEPGRGRPGGPRHAHDPGPDHPPAGPRPRPRRAVRRVRRYTVYDLPWVNALQGYFLIRSLPGVAVRLYGEDAGDLRVLPYWKLNDEPARACGYLVNTDSLPEMGYPTARGYLPEIRRVT